MVDAVLIAPVFNIIINNRHQDHFFGWFSQSQNEDDLEVFRQFQLGMPVPRGF